MYENYACNRVYMESTRSQECGNTYDSANSIRIVTDAYYLRSLVDILIIFRQEKDRTMKNWNEALIKLNFHSHCIIAFGYLSFGRVAVKTKCQVPVRYFNAVFKYSHPCLRYFYV